MRATAEPPGPSGLAKDLPFGVGHADTATSYLEAAARYGDVVRLRLPSGRGYLLSHPEMVKEVLVSRSRDFTKSRALQRAKRLLGNGLLTSEGEDHLRQRRLIQPAFHRERLNEYGAVMTDYARRAAECWQPGTEFDVAREMMRLTLSIVGKTLFGADVESEADAVTSALTEVQNLLPLSLLPLSEWFDRVPLPSNVRFWKARRELDMVIYRIIRSRRGFPDRGDLLSMLLSARDAENDGTGMTDEQLRDECMTLLLAGHETTANALTWTWYLLSRNPIAETRLHEEVDRTLGGRSPGSADLAGLPYAQMVVQEAMRLYPPAWVIGRRALKPFVVGGYVIPARSIVLMSPFVIHRDPRWYPEPETFEPERFRTEEIAVRHKYSYIPFGGGPRVCIGEAFARMEAVLVLATIAQRWRLRYARAVAPGLLPLMTLRPKNGMPMTALARV